MSVNGVQQLKQLTFKYCRISGSSRGLMQYIREDLSKTATKHPSLEIELSLRPQKHPYMIASYGSFFNVLIPGKEVKAPASGKEKTVSLMNYNIQTVKKHVELLINSDGSKPERMKHYNVARGDIESCQGKWTESLDVSTLVVERVENREALGI